MKKAFILGAGLGTRLQPLTNILPKPLVPVRNRPLIHHALDLCLEAGILEFAINTHHLPHTWAQHFPDNQYKGAPITFYHEPHLLETGGGLKNIAPFIGNEPLLVFNADALTNIRIDKLITSHLYGNNPATLAVRSTGAEKRIAVEGRNIIDIRNELGIAKGTHQFTGIYCIDPELLDLIPSGEKISVIPALLQLAKEKQLTAYHADQGHWLDLGTKEAYLAAHHNGAENHIHPTAKIAPETHITNSWIGADCQIQSHTTIKNSILWPNTTVQTGTTLTDTILTQ